MTTDSPPFASMTRTASSTPHSSCGLMVNPRCRVSRACPSAVSTILPPVNGTRLTQTRMQRVTTESAASCPDAHVLGVEDRSRAGDRHGHRVPLTHVFDCEGGADHG